MTEPTKSTGKLELIGFEKEKFEKIRACPNCPAMLEEAGETYASDRIEHDWYCDDCGASITKVFKEVSTRWSIFPRPGEPRRPRINVNARALHGFEKEKFETTRACPVCPGMLNDRVEKHLSNAVVYIWECTKCGGRVTERFDQQQTLWEPAKAVTA